MPFKFNPCSPCCGSVVPCQSMVGAITRCPPSYKPSQIRITIESDISSINGYTDFLFRNGSSELFTLGNFNQGIEIDNYTLNCYAWWKLINTPTAIFLQFDPTATNYDDGAVLLNTEYRSGTALQLGIQCYFDPNRPSKIGYYCYVQVIRDCLLVTGIGSVQGSESSEVFWIPVSSINYDLTPVDVGSCKPFVGSISTTLEKFCTSPPQDCISCYETRFEIVGIYELTDTPYGGFVTNTSFDLTGKRVNVMFTEH